MKHPLDEIDIEEFAPQEVLLLTFARKDRSEHYLAQQCNRISRNLSVNWKSPEKSHFLFWFRNRQKIALFFKEK